MPRRYMEMDANLYERCSREIHEKNLQHENYQKNSKEMWKSIREAASQKGII